jgi:ATP-dependent RNA helicase UAP56/SUB2
MMFSATMSQNMKNIGRKFMKNPFELFIDQEGKLTLHGLKQYYVKLDENQKIARLMELLDSLMFNQVIIFVKKLQSAIKLDDLLRSQMFPSVCIYGSLPQEERIKRYNEFKAFKYRIMVSTDIFGRGIDIEKINIVFNFDMPDKADTYLHKVSFDILQLTFHFAIGRQSRKIRN